MENIILFPEFMILSVEFGIFLEYFKYFKCLLCSSKSAKKVCFCGSSSLINLMQIAQIGSVLRLAKVLLLGKLFHTAGLNSLQTFLDKNLLVSNSQV